MREIEKMRRKINQEQSSLRKALNAGAAHEAWIARFLRHHAMLHSGRISGQSVWSYEDALLDDLPHDAYRRIPQGQTHTIAWIIWHIARIEDAAMNLLVAGSPQCLVSGDWLARLGVSAKDSGNEQSEEDVLRFSALVDIPSLRAYRADVGARTREIVAALRPGDPYEKVLPARLQRVQDEGVFVAEAEGIIDYWGKRTIAGLLLMPASRHILTHLTEALALKRKLKIK